MNNPVGSIQARQITILDRPRMTIFSALAMIILAYEAFRILIVLLTGPAFNLSLLGYSGVMNSYIVHDPVIFALIFLTGITLFFSGDHEFGSRRRFRFAGLMLLIGSVLYPLTQYFSPVSLFILLTLESTGASEILVSGVYNLVQSVIIFTLVLLPLTFAGTELFLSKERRIAIAAMALFLISIIVQTAILGIPSSVYNHLSRLVGGQYMYAISIASLPEYLQLMTLILLLLTFARHRVLILREIRNRKLPSP